MGDACSEHFTQALNVIAVMRLTVSLLARLQCGQRSSTGGVPILESDGIRLTLHQTDPPQPDRQPPPAAITSRNPAPVNPGKFPSGYRDSAWGFL